jgi:1-deoxy-D-xylulose-5-phosphate reductoisomerase
LTYPERVGSDRVQTNFVGIGSLTFEEPDADRFPSLGLARRAGDTCGTMPAVFNAANEVAVEAFLGGRIKFPQIPELVCRIMDAHQVVASPTLDQILEADAWARRAARV